MIQIIKMAFRDLGRNRRRSFFSSLALAIGLALLLLQSSVVRGEMRNSMEASIRLQSGHLQVQSATYQEDKTSLAWEDLVANPEQIASQISSLQPVRLATPRLFASGILANGKDSFGVRIIGIDPLSEGSRPYQDGLMAGTFLDPADREGILIGVKLANKFNLKTGDRVNLLVNTSNGDVDEQMFTIRGVYTTQIPSYDESTVFMPLAKAQAIAQADNHASTIFVMLQDREQAGAVAAALQASDYQVKTWQEMNSVLTETEQYSQAFFYVLYLVVLAITATVIVNTLVMSVFERTREIGILSAVGMKSSTIMSMFFVESAMLAVGGIIMGLILGGLMVLYASSVGFYIGDMGVTGMLMSDRIYGYLTLRDAVTLSILALIVSLLAALYPALLAARMEPVTALRGGK